MDSTAPTPKLSVELVPRSQWAFNLRSELRPRDWDRIRKATYAAAGHRCELCGGVGRKHPVEAHERWEYNDELHIQKLVGVEALCPQCHRTKHFGLAVQMGLGSMCKAHMMRVNRWTSAQADAHLTHAFEVWRRRSAVSWTLDLTWLKGVR